MSNSPLVTFTLLSPNHSGKRTQPIWILTIHCVVGHASLQSLGNVFLPTSRRASSNYGIDDDGNVGMYCEEANRSWCTGSQWNDQRAVTVEVASDVTAPWAFTQSAYDGAIRLAVDVCQRNGKKRLLYLGSLDATMAYENERNPTDMVLTAHRWFQATACVPVDSEVLTRNGWKRIDEVQVGEDIACASLDGLRISFEEVYDKVPEYEHDTYTNNDFTATKDHRMVYSVHQSKDFYRIATYNELLHSGNNIYIPLAGNAQFDGLPISNEMLSFLCAVQADGHYMYDKRVDGSKSYYGVEFHVSKDRKIQRIEELLCLLNFDYRKTYQSDGSVKLRIYNADGVNYVNDVCEKWLSNKRFTWDWLNLSPDQAAFFLDDIQFWDGCYSGKRYDSKDRENLDIVNAIAALNGVGSRVLGDSVQFRDAPYAMLSKNTTIRNNKRNHTEKTRVTCVSVKTGIFLCRQHGKTFIIGNCPGDWFYQREAQFAAEVTEKLGGTPVDPGLGALYRVRRTWDDATTQIGAFSILSNAKKMADQNPGYYVFDSEGRTVYPSCEYLVRVSVNDLNIRSGPGTNYYATGAIPPGVYTIVETSSGPGANNWGKLKSGAGWIALDYTLRLD